MKQLGWEHEHKTIMCLRDNNMKRYKWNSNISSVRIIFNIYSITNLAKYYVYFFFKILSDRINHRLK